MKPATEKKTPPFLEGGGEMGELIRTYDWTKTPVGPFDAWPVSLRTAMGLMLTSRVPMLLFWGKDLLTFYNDAFRPSLGANGKHPSSLGQRGEESWAESWPTIGPMIHSVMSGGDPVWLEDQKLPIYRNGKMDYAYWTYSFSPVRNDEDEIGGLLVTCAETTRAVENLQRLNDTNNELQQTLAQNLLLQKAQRIIDLQFKNVANTSPAGLWLSNEESGLTYLNQTLVDWTGMAYEDLLGFGWVNAIIEEDRQRAAEVFLGAVAVRSHYDVQFRITKADGRIVWCRAAGDPYCNEEGGYAGYVGFCMDIDESVKRQQSIEESRRQLLGLFEQSPVAIAMLSKDRLTVTMANAFYCEIIDKKHDDIIGKPLLDVLPEIAGQGFDKLMNDVIVTGTPYVANEVPAQLVRNGRLETFYVNLTYNPVREADGSVSGVFVVATDITPQVATRKKIEETAKKLNTLIQSAPVAIGLFIGRDLVIETPNETFIEIVGRGPDIAGKSLRTVMPELESQPFLQILDNVFSSGKTFKMYGARRLVQREGGLLERYFDVTFSPLLDDHGAVTAILDISVDVTEQVLNRKRLEESEAGFRSLVEEAPFATALYEGEGLTVAVANEAMIKLWGKTPAVVGMPLAKALPELEGQPFLPLLREIFRTGQTYQAKEQSADLVIDGRLQRFYFNFTYKPLFDTTGKVYAILNMAVDVTQQVLAKRQLEESELFARSIIDNSPVAKIVFTGEGMVITTVNRNMLAMLGRDESIIGKTFTEAVPELIPTPLMDRLRHVYASSETFVQPEEKIVLIKDGQPYTGYYQYIYKALRNIAGEIYGIICTATEITAQVEARKKIEEAEAVLAGAIDLAELATWSVDLLTARVSYSPRMQEWLGVKEGVLEREGSSKVTKRDQVRVRAALLKAIEPGGSGRFDEVYTIVHQQTGQERIIHANGRTLYDAEGIPVSFSGTAQDVTVQTELQLALEREVQTRTEELAAAVEELRATNEELAESNAQLLRSNEELAQYAYVASHDLQEPLRKIRLFSGRLNPREQSAAEVQATLEKIQSSADRMSLLIKDLLEFSQLLKSDSLLRPVALNTVIRDVAADFELTIAEKEAEIKAAELPVIEGVSLQLSQLFYNLVGNALKFTKDGRKPVIRLTSRPATAEETAAHLEKIIAGVRYHFITVSDNGIGFEPQYLEQIFEVFKRLHGRTEYAGSGIGLALCRRIVQNHQGTIYAEAHPDEGAAFHILLPEKQTAYQSSVPDGFVWKE